VNDVGSLEASVRELFATLLGVSIDRVDDRAQPATIESWDSMQHLILVSGFEEEFGIDVDPEEAVDMYESFAVFKRIVLKKLENRR
jgi:acyl carrier protein